MRTIKGTVATGADAFAMNVRRELERLTGRCVAIGSIYVTWIVSRPRGSRPRQRDEAITRRLFSVTGAGARALAETRALRERLWEGVELRRLLRNV
jgi:PadR family transcriptional regulator PadR